MAKETFKIESDVPSPTFALARCHTVSIREQMLYASLRRGGVPAAVALRQARRVASR